MTRAPTDERLTGRQISVVLIDWLHEHVVAHPGPFDAAHYARWADLWEWIGRHAADLALGVRALETAGRQRERALRVSAGSLL
jgi:hypothetical protein